MNSRIAEYILLALVAFFFGAYGLVAIWKQSFIAIDGNRYFTIADDGLITLRYAWNLAHGNGLVWNPGERIEGITNTLWALQASVFSIFLRKPFLPLAMQLTGILWLIITAWCFRQIAKTLEPSDNPLLGAAIGIVAFLLPLSYSPLVVWGLKGMETSLQGALIAGAVLAFIRARARPSIFGSLLLGLACATRPDCIVPSAVILGIRSLYVMMRKHRWQDLMLEIIPFVTILGGLTLFRLAYYGAAVPNTYTLKVDGMSVLERIQLNGIGYIKPFLTMSLSLLFASVLSLLVRPSMGKFTLVGLPVAMIVYTVYVGGDAFGGWRFLAPYIPFAFLSLLLDVPQLDHAIRSNLAESRLGSWRSSIITAVAIVFILTIARPPMIDNYVSLLRKPNPTDVANINTAIWLNDVLEPSATVGVFYAGSVPFYTSFFAYDFLGKCDRHIAKVPPDKSGAVSWQGQTSVPGHNKYDLYYSILDKQPTYVENVKWASQDVTVAALKLYQPVSVPFTTGFSYSKHEILLRRESPFVRWKRITGTGK